MITQGQIDQAAIQYNQTKDPHTKNKWYKKLKEWANGPHNIKRRNVSTRRSNETDDGTYRVIR